MAEENKNKKKAITEITKVNENKSVFLLSAEHKWSLRVKNKIHVPTQCFSSASIMCPMKYY